MITNSIKKLRNRETLNLFDSKEKLFVKIQLNKNEKFICWERWVSKDKQNWVNWNLYLSLKDVKKVLLEIIKNRLMTDMKTVIEYDIEIGETVVQKVYCGDGRAIAVLPDNKLIGLTYPKMENLTNDELIDTSIYRTGEISNKVTFGDLMMCYGKKV